MSYCKITICGNVGKEPELRVFPSGDRVATFSVATTETWRDKSGQKQEKVSWHNVQASGKAADIVEQYVGRGKSVLIDGSVEYQSWEKDGAKHYKTVIKVGHPNSKLVLLGGGKRQGDDETPESRPVDTDETPF